MSRKAQRPVPVRPEYVDTDAAAAYLGVHRRTLQLWRASGDGPRSYVLGRLRRYRLDELDAWVEQHADPGPGTAVAQ